ncbi:PREDICTED: uncharacterized protein LOC109131139 [Camelina sativa]|uniref:Uncharacterized protein LOC109131139 n=1 Tax=Camelina sativa TaxID=90675 RepID=A0ABM1RE70_CAMSA|nr:PREDICTED: uncharacterized protein LOC109131139 [Camelina sativa]
MKESNHHYKLLSFGIVDCIGVLDGLQIPAHLPTKHQSRFHNKKGILTQNVLAACTFDSQFIFVYPGWEGSVEDLHILRAVLDDPNQNFPQAPKGKYYLVDREYTNTQGFIAPYPGTRYCLHEFRGASQMPQNAHELFNHRHMSLSNVIQRSFSMLKTRFPILISAPQYPFHVQRDLVIATCTLHNFIKREDGVHDWLFAACAEVCWSSGATVWTRGRRTGIAALEFYAYRCCC